ncbi:hypothetical protein CSUI_005729, partial [Cystoisospora suis]
ASAERLRVFCQSPLLVESVSTFPCRSRVRNALFPERQEPIPILVLRRVTSKSEVTSPGGVPVRKRKELWEVVSQPPSKARKRQTGVASQLTVPKRRRASARAATEIPRRKQRLRTAKTVSPFRHSVSAENQHGKPSSASSRPGSFQASPRPETTASVISQSGGTQEGQVRSPRTGTAESSSFFTGFSPLSGPSSPQGSFYWSFPQVGSPGEFQGPPGPRPGPQASLQQSSEYTEATAATDSLGRAEVVQSGSPPFWPVHVLPSSGELEEGYESWSQQSSRARM